MTIETEVIFPKRKISGETSYKILPGNISSIFGLHAVKADNEDLSFENDTINFNVVANRSDNDLRNVKFALKTEGSTIFSEIENASSFAGVYDNEKWNLAFRLRPTKCSSRRGCFIWYDESYKRKNIFYKTKKTFCWF